MILCSNPLAQYLSHKTEIDEAISRVLNKGWYVLGEEVKLFEKEFSEYIGVNYGIGVGSGTEALHIALKSCDIGSGDEVITVSHTAVATVSAIELTGAKPVFVDIESDYYTINTSKIEKAITKHTKAIIPVHIYGQPVDMDKIIDIAKKHKLFVIEDCAQSHGAKYNGRNVGSFGDIACFSFYPTKNLGAIGDGGIIVTSNKKLAEKSKLLREYGWAERYVSHISGWNSRLDELQAAILRVKLKYLDKDNSKRRKLAELYNKELAVTGLVLPKVSKNSTHVFHLYVVRSKKRDDLLKYLKNNGIGALIHYPVPVHLQPAYKIKSKLVETEIAAKEIISLPMYPELSESDVKTVCNIIKNFKKGV
ncbi:MAG: DegT/DnrJ/EryC1/StrS family aminotransferase [Elusimicrobiota bacterium]